jgi:hypothetical protein
LIAQRPRSIASRSLVTASCLLAAGAISAAPAAAADGDFRSLAAPLLRQFCYDCHSGTTAEGQVNLEQMAAEAAFGTGFKRWRKVAAMLEKGQMPPQDATLPTDDQRQQLVSLVRGELRRAAEQNAGDPGNVVLRRLTSAEYAYATGDLTGLDLDLQREFVSDAAGGEGFTNFGSVQFFDDANLERYLEAAKKVAAHAVIGSGPLQFFTDPGKTGLELSAIDRIRRIYREHGFRTAAGEGGEPFGLDCYPKAFYVAWRYQHRDRLGLSNIALDQLSAQDGLPPKFVEHVSGVLSRQSPSFPLSEIAQRWEALPQPASENGEEQVRAACQELYGYMADMQTRLAKAVGNEEEAAVLSENSIQVELSHSFVARFAWMEPLSQTRLQFSVVSADPSRDGEPVVIWKNPRFRFRRNFRQREEPQPLAAKLSAEAARPFNFGQHRRGGAIDPQSFVTIGAQSRTFDLEVPAGARGLELLVDVSLDLAHGEDGVVRCSITEGGDAAPAKSVSALLANPAGDPFQKWKTGVVEFARLLPQVSHREPAPSDRDPIPAPFDNAYNMPERNFFHTGVKYHRDDQFLVDHLLTGDTRERLDQAWADLLSSFEYHDILLRFVADKYQLDLPAKGIAALDDGAINRLPAEHQDYVRQLRAGYAEIQKRLRAAEPGHLDEVTALASRAWRRPLADDEQAQLRAFYHRLRRQDGLDHSQALRALLTRILVAPAFLYRAERPPDQPGIVALSDWELASRLSFFVWSSLPDDELRRAATAGELRDQEQLAQQARRMFRDPKAQRFATEFFGQWLGFYQFNRYRGVDPERFPEFDDRLKAALYDEAIAFFEHIVREDRPVSEILFADYAFVNSDLAKHYSLDNTVTSAALARVAGLSGSHRGGLFGLGAVLTATSAPLRTSPVKRGDWVLRRVLGTPVPPPPANAGSIAADESPTDGKTVRQRLEAHRREAACVNCHSRIDPLGFALEHYDPLGRWRETYRNSEPIDDAQTLGDGTIVAGVDGLRKFLRDRQADFYQNLCTKLLAYSLGRGELASDRSLSQQLMADVRSGDGCLSDLVVDIVKSPQFRNRRGRDNEQPANSTAVSNPEE